MTRIICSRPFCVQATLRRISTATRHETERRSGWFAPTLSRQPPFPCPNLVEGRCCEEVENPFGTDANDLPIDDLAKTIAANVREILVGGTTN